MDVVRLVAERGGGLADLGGNLIKKVLFPAEVLPIVSVLSNMVHFFLGLLILGRVLRRGVHGHYPGLGRPHLRRFPAMVVVIQFIFTTGLALVLSALTVHFRDIRDLLSNLLTFWFFATPIIYAYYMARACQEFRWLLQPESRSTTSPCRIRRSCSSAGRSATCHWRARCSASSRSRVFLAGYWLFDRLRDSFAEVV